MTEYKPKVTLQDYKNIIVCLKDKNAYLTSKIKYFESIQADKCCECCYDAVQELSNMHFECMYFDDDYFKGLNYQQIAELAKKALRLTADNCTMQHVIEDIQELLQCDDSDEETSKAMLKKIRKIIKKYEAKNGKQVQK